MLLIGVFSIVVSYISGENFFKAARHAQLYSLNRVIEVAAMEIMQELRDHTYEISSVFSTKGDIPKEYKTSLGTSDKTALIQALNDPMITGFVGAYQVDLVKIRVYDLQHRFYAESGKGVQGLAERMPEHLYKQSFHRKGVERTKAVFGLWQHGNEAYYSMLVPIGGIFVTGYLEVVVNPIVNLAKLSEKMGSPVSIRSGQDVDIYYVQPDKDVENLLPIEYMLKTGLGEPAFYLVSYEDIGILNEEFNRTIIDTIAMFVGLVALILIGAIWLFQTFLFRPINAMFNQMKQIENDNFVNDLEIEGLKEIDILAEEFNKMTREIRSRQEELRHLSIVDELTSVANRRKFNEVLRREYLNGCRTKNPLSLLIIDIDFFKKYNDTYGHPAGDECLKKVAAALEDSLYRPTDLVARYGGEEFVVILPYTPNNGEHVVAQKIMDEIAKLNIPHEASEVDKKVTVSIGGYTLIPSIHYDPDFIVAEADKSLYQAKQAGRNQYVLHNTSVSGDE